MSQLNLILLPEKLGICKLEKSELIPAWALKSTFFSITRTLHELSIVASQDAIPEHIKTEKDWRAFMIEGPLDFSLSGILASLLVPLANDKISVFALATYDTDYILIKETNLERVKKILGTFCKIKN